MQALWMVASALFFSMMGVCVKFASAGFNSFELVFWRGVISILFLALVARTQGVSLATRYPGAHAWRSLVGTASLGAWFYAIAHIPLATAMTLNYMSSVWIAVFLVAGALLAWVPRPRPVGGPGNVSRPPLQGALVFTVLIAFGGVLLMLRPSVGQDQGFASMIGLMSGLVAAFAYMQVVVLSRLGEPEARVVFYFAVGSAVFGLVGMGFTGMSPWNWAHAVWLLPIGVLASLGQLAMTRAYGSARTPAGTLLVANLHYSGIVFAGLWSVLLFNDPIDMLGWLGMALIVGSGVAATILRQRTVPKAPPAEER